MLLSTVADCINTVKPSGGRSVATSSICISVLRYLDRALDEMPPTHGWLLSWLKSFNWSETWIRRILAGRRHAARWKVVNQEAGHRSWKHAYPKIFDRFIWWIPWNPWITPGPFFWAKCLRVMPSGKFF
jgi:hypothetical protein